MRLNGKKNGGGGAEIFYDKLSKLLRTNDFGNEENIFMKVILIVP